MDPMDKERDMAGNHAADHSRRNFLQLAGCGLGMVALAAGPRRAMAQATSASKLKIGSIGAGRMGGALGALFVKAGHPVMFSSRHPENIKPLAERLGPLAQAAWSAYRSRATIRRPSPSPRGSSAAWGSSLSSWAASPWASTWCPVRRWPRSTLPRKFERSPAACADPRRGALPEPRGCLELDDPR